MGSSFFLLLFFLHAKRRRKKVMADGRRGDGGCDASGTCSRTTNRLDSKPTHSTDTTPGTPQDAGTTVNGN